MKENIDLVSEPIFLVGAERSGTTILRLMLDHHPQIAWCSEFEYAVDKISESSELPQLNEYYQWLETNGIFQDSGFTIDRSLSYPQLVNSFLVQKRDRAGKSIVGAAVHRHFDRLLQIWPHARFIHLVRDGRDVARSSIGMGWAGNVWTGLERWIDAEKIWTQLSSIIPAERQIEVKYETLICEPIDTLKKICEFIGTSYDPAMFGYTETTRYDLPDPKLIQQWRHKLSNYEIQLVESRIGTMLQERGYELSGLPHLTVTPVMEQKLKLQDWWARVQFRLQRYGLALFLADYLSRKLNLTQWQKSVKVKMYDINRAYFK
jgi:hypothetical protein